MSFIAFTNAEPQLTNILDTILSANAQTARKKENEHPQIVTGYNYNPTSTSQNTEDFRQEYIHPFVGVHQEVSRFQKSAQYPS